ncbi:hypothetical protein [Roseateles toxinivorans]|uniref:hypothetical protein n=1 Tax=Roseateles toxinivorans TaxID=270368 RepID=UPI00105EAF42|nr:hypothetical protein [Roseateles toxinivorans]
MDENQINDADPLRLDELKAFVNSTGRTDRQILKRIESLNLSADAKALLADLLRVATKVGEHLLRVGRKIIDFVLLMLEKFPLLSFAVIIAAVVAALLGALPLLGGALSAVLTPLALALGVTWGAKLETESPDLAERVRDFATAFSRAAA